MSGKPGIVLYNYKKSRPKFNLITNEDKEVPPLLLNDTIY